MVQTLSREAAVTDNKPESLHIAAATSIQKIAVVADDAIMLMSWEFADQTIACDTFASPEAFLERVYKDQKYLSSLNAIVTDLNFDNSTLSGFDLAEKIRGIHAAAKIFLCTNAEQTDSNLSAAIAAVLPKNAEDAMVVLKKYLA